MKNPDVPALILIVAAVLLMETCADLLGLSMNEAWPGGGWSEVFRGLLAGASSIRLL